jgi:electron transfer flavoprotein beta subunit
MDTRALADLVGDVTATTKQLGVTLPPARAAGQKVADIATLVAKLADEAKVI